MTPAGGHAAALERLGLPPVTTAALVRYLDTLAAWSSRVNLTGVRTPDERVQVLVAPVVTASSLVEGPTLIDVGSGNGSPGLVLALLRPELSVRLLEPRRRRWAFLREAVRATGAHVDVRAARHDGDAGPAARTVTVRALALPVAEIAPLVAPGGRLLVFGRPPDAGAGLVAEGPLRPGVWSYRRST